MQAHGGKREGNLRIFPEVEHHRQAERHNLANHRGQPPRRPLPGGNAQTAKNEQGTNTMSKFAPIPWVTMVNMVRPVAWSSRSKTISPKMPKENRVQIRKYCTPPSENFRNIRLDLEKYAGTKGAKQHEQQAANPREHQAISRRQVPPVIFPGCPSTWTGGNSYQRPRRWKSQSSGFGSGRPWRPPSGHFH